jgi:hypothetical protein
MLERSVLQARRETRERRGGRRERLKQKEMKVEHPL